MHTLFRDNAKLVVAMTVCLSLGLAAPAVSSGSGNADTVDGKHAVGAKASAAKRAGKLVATSQAGRLPNNIITKAKDANRLDGLDSTAFLGADAKATDADKVDGLDSTAFLGAGAKATDADRLDGLSSAAFQRTVPYAQVAAAGFLFGAQRGVTSVDKTGTGAYEVQFAGSVRNCSHVVTLLDDFGFVRTVQGSRYGGPDQEVRVNIANTSGTLADGAFTIAAIC